MVTKELVKSVSGRILECRENGCFSEMADGVEEGMSIKDAADRIVKGGFATYSQDVVEEKYGVTPDQINSIPDVERIIRNDLDLELVAACHEYKEGRGDARGVVKTWNKAMYYNGETHGTIFTGLYKHGEYELLDELMNDIDNNFHFDT